MASAARSGSIAALLLRDAAVGQRRLHAASIFSTMLTLLGLPALYLWLRRDGAGDAPTMIG